MEFEIKAFTERLRELMYNSYIFPYEGDALKRMKHKKTPLHIRDVAFRDNPTTFGTDTNVFEIGNEKAERTYPYYHILEDAPVIRKRERGTKKTKGSQATITDLGKRDYGMVSWNGKTFSKEYARNVRGSRNRKNNVSRYMTDYNGTRWFINRQANAYENTHYHYIENMLNSGILDTIANEFGLIRKRTIDTGLKEEYINQYYDIDSYNGSSDIIDMISSFL